MRSLRRYRPSPPLDDDDLLAEILLRLPSEPSSLPRASAVCKRWRCLASDPGFSRRFRRHHRRNPPLLGCFMRDGNEFLFGPTLEPPNRVPEGRFPFPIHSRFMFLGCRHGFLLVLSASQEGLKLLVWDPVNGNRHPIAFPPGFDEKILSNGSVLRAALGDIQNFQVVLVSTDVQQRAIACVYSSETEVWGNIITTPLPPKVNISLTAVDPTKPAVLVGDSLYILLFGMSSSILELDVDRQSLAVIPQPVGLYPRYTCHCSVMRAEGGGLGLLYVSTSSAQLWKRKTDCDGTASWVLGRTIDLGNLLSLHLENHRYIHILGFAEENNVVFLRPFGGEGDFMIQLDSLQFKKLPETSLRDWHTFESVYAAGI